LCAFFFRSVYSGLSDEQAAADTIYSDISDSGKHQQLIPDLQGVAKNNLCRILPIFKQPLIIF